MVRRIRRARSKGTRRRYRRSSTRVRRSRRVGKGRVRGSYMRRVSSRRTHRKGKGRRGSVRVSRRGRMSRRNYSKSRRMRGGKFIDFGSVTDFGNDMMDKIMNKVSDVRDIPMETNSKIGDGVARAAEYASKWGLSGPASNMVKMVDTVSGNNPVVDGRSNMSIFDHPILSKPTY